MSQFLPIYHAPSPVLLGVSVLALSCLFFAKG